MLNTSTLCRKMCRDFFFSQECVGLTTFSVGEIHNYTNVIWQLIRLYIKNRAVK